MTAFIGVLISWLIVARKALFACVAASASCAGALELGDVVVDAEEADVGAVHRELDELQLDIDRCSVLTSAPRDSLRATDFHRLLRDLAPLAVIGAAEDKLVDGATKRLFRRVAKELRGRRIPVGHPLVGVHHNHRCGTDRDERLQVLALPLDLGEETCVLDSDTDVGRDRGEQAHVSFSESAFLLDALDADHADRLLADQDRDADVGEGRRADQGFGAPFVLLLTVEHEWTRANEGSVT